MIAFSDQVSGLTDIIVSSIDSSCSQNHLLLIVDTNLRITQMEGLLGQKLFKGSEEQITCGNRLVLYDALCVV